MKVYTIALSDKLPLWPFIEIDTDYGYAPQSIRFERVGSVTGTTVTNQNTVSFGPFALEHTFSGFAIRADNTMLCYGPLSTRLMPKDVLIFKPGAMVLNNWNYGP